PTNYRPKTTPHSPINPVYLTPKPETAKHDCNRWLREAGVAWMRMMGADSVAYHEKTVMGRADDFPGRALAYYASRGETPLVWGGAGADRLGLVGRVTEAQYRAIYGPGGACDPTTGERLVSTTRPGMELVIAAHKSVAELGVIGRAEDMHR